MDFLDVIETYRADQATVQNLFGGEGRSVRAVGEANSKNPRYTQLLMEAAALVRAVATGQKPMRMFQEAMSTSDFPQLFGDIIDRAVLANYREKEMPWQNYLKKATVRDFRTVKRFRVDGAEGQLDEVAAGAPYPTSEVHDAEYTYSVTKYGRRLDFLWEVMINDDLDALKDGPARLARAARRTIQKKATALYMDTSGPHASVFTSGNANIVTANPALSITGLQTAMTVLGNQLDSDSEPIEVEMVHLVVPPALEPVANNIINATELWTSATGGGATGQELHVANWMRNRLTVSVDPYIPIIATSNDNTTWFLFADPQGGRPFAEVGFLAGHEEPEVFMRTPNAVRVGGAAAGTMDGDFDADGIAYKVRLVNGRGVMDPKMAVGSNGSGS